MFSVFAINDGCKHVKASTYKYLLRKYEIKGKFGMATNNFMSHGKVVERSTYCKCVNLYSNIHFSIVLWMKRTNIHIFFAIIVI